MTHSLVGLFSTCYQDDFKGSDVKFWVTSYVVDLSLMRGSSRENVLKTRQNTEKILCKSILQMSTAMGIRRLNEFRRRRMFSSYYTLLYVHTKARLLIEFLNVGVAKTCRGKCF